jgi:mRNA interferase RelE/StbE
LLARLLPIIAFTSIADRYLLNLKPRSLSLPRQIQGKILEKIQLLENDLVGDVKKLTNFTPEYRLRVGNYRVLFEIEDTNIVIYRVKPRDKAYQ